MSHSMVTSTQRKKRAFRGHPALTRLSDQSSRYLDRDGTALRLNMSLQTFIRMERRGQGPPTTISSGGRYYRIAALDAWLLSRETDDSTVWAAQAGAARTVRLCQTRLTKPRSLAPSHVSLSERPLSPMPVGRNRRCRESRVVLRVIRG